ncbi:hypothetical protein EVJ58_g3377 [Rhodofomes roseus]|uniref:non-specific serine/threonine protein kinase n=1 Tax=Rhodofomes roseus TaxID=34475 RepID=A0A4Y9YN48_9APHY|nr:hypothetical protein EVJ58_g3377 [Rhodofomes roseus]
MLSGRTKQVVAYGRRGRRIVNASDDPRRSENVDAGLLLQPTPKKNYIDADWDLSPEVKLAAKKRKPLGDPGPSMKASKKAAMKSKKSPKIAKVGKAEVSVPVRHPLAVFSSNTPGSPAVPSLVVKKKRKTALSKNSPLKSSSPIVNVDIVVLDGAGRRVSQERRISRTDVQVNRADMVAAGASKHRKISAKLRHSDVSSDASEIVVPKPKLKKGSRTRPIVISDDSDTEEDDVPLAKIPKPDFSLESPRQVPPKYSTGSSNALPPTRLHRKSIRNKPAAPTISALPPPAPAFIPWTPKPIIPTYVPPSPSPIHQHVKTRKAGSGQQSRSFLVPGHSPFPHAAKERKVTPYRAHRNGTSLFLAPPSPPSPTTLTDLDLSLEFANLALSPTLRQSAEAEDVYAPPQPAHLVPLLKECAQETPHEFSAFIELFPLDPIVRGDYLDVESTQGRAQARFQKIGEASYSEVFGIGDVVLKVIPLRDEEQTSSGDDGGLESPAPSDAKDVLKEIIVTRAMGEICPGFVKLLRTYVVRGKYPSLLLDLWDNYNEKKGSESVRPDTFGVSQLYAIIVLPNGGPDLETFTFKAATKTGWKQACSLFWQVTRTLAEAEGLVRFEHRDLHWGQILVKTVASSSSAHRGAGKMAMDDESHGIEATVIDLGLARMETSDGAETHWTPFEEEVFEGEGDYQFDVYRMMRVHNGDSWEAYRPLTNVMWLHYLASKLLHFKRLRPPPAARKTSTRTAELAFSERECYNCLVEIEELLGRCAAACKPPPVSRKSRRKTQAPVKTSVKADPSGPRCAGDVLQLAITKGWVYAG